MVRIVWNVPPAYLAIVGMVWLEMAPVCASLTMQVNTVMTAVLVSLVPPAPACAPRVSLAHATMD